LRHNFKAFDVLVVLSQFIKLRFQVEVFVGELKLAGPFLDVRLDVRNTFNIGQIAAHGSGTAASGHFR
jgi:hypothetical protein